MPPRRRCPECNTFVANDATTCKQGHRVPAYVPPAEPAPEAVATHEDHLEEWEKRDQLYPGQRSAYFDGSNEAVIVGGEVVDDPNLRKRLTAAGIKRLPKPRLLRFVSLTRRTWPARAPWLTFWAVLILAAMLGFRGGAIAVLAAGCGIGALLYLRQSERWLIRRRELKYLKGKWWEELVEKIWEQPKETREMGAVDPPALIEVDSSGFVDEQFPHEILYVQGSSHTSNPAELVELFGQKIARELGAYAADRGSPIYTPGGPVVPYRINYQADMSLPPLHTARVSRPGVLHFGRFLSGEEIVYDLFDAAQNPIILVAGKSGTGKSSTMNIPVATGIRWNGLGLEPTQIDVIDGGNGTDFKWSEAFGVRVHTIDDGRDALEEIADELEARAAMLGDQEVKVKREDGSEVDVLLRKWSELGPAHRETMFAERGHGLRILVIDEAQNIVGADKKSKYGFSRTQRDIQRIGAACRKAGCIVVIGLHRPDASILGGYFRDLIAGKITHGKPSETLERMMHGKLGDIATNFALDDEVPPGIGQYEGAGSPVAGQFPRWGQGYLIDPRYLVLNSAVREADPSTRQDPPKGGLWRDGDKQGFLGKDGAYMDVLRVGRLIGPAMRLVVAQPRGVERDEWRDFRAVVGERDQVCKVCQSMGEWQADHVVPLWAGGDDDPHTNGQRLCVRCHAIKTWLEARARKWARRLW